MKCIKLSSALLKQLQSIEGGISGPAGGAAILAPNSPNSTC